MRDRETTSKFDIGHRIEVTPDSTKLPFLPSRQRRTTSTEENLVGGGEGSTVLLSDPNLTRAEMERAGNVVTIVERLLRKQHLRDLGTIPLMVL